MAKEQKSQQTKPDTSQRPKKNWLKGQVGRDIPDESKERHTEIAVEAGRKGMTQHMKH